MWSTICGEKMLHYCMSQFIVVKWLFLIRMKMRHWFLCLRGQNTHEKQRQQKQQQLKEQRYKCFKCPREYRSKTHLEKHLDLAHLAPKQPRVYSCAVCSATFTSRSRRYVQGMQKIVGYNFLWIWQMVWCLPVLSIIYEVTMIMIISLLFAS